MDVVASTAVRAPTPMSRRTRHAHHHQLAADPLPPPPFQARTASISNVVQVKQPSQRMVDLEDEVQVQTRTTGISNGVQVQQPSQRRTHLEHEVAELKQQLSNEQTVHDVLERALHPASARSGSGSVVLNIPAFIPSKAKELLAELVLVEEEIARLESQITTMKGGLAAAQHQRASAMAVTTAHSSYRPPSVYTNSPNGNRGGNGNANANGSGGMTGTTVAQAAAAPPPLSVSTRQDATDYSYPTRVYRNHENGTTLHAPAPAPAPAPTRQPANQVAPDIKSMFFISQAMNAEYLKRHLAADDSPAKSPKDHPTKGSGAAAAAAAVSPMLNSNIFALPPRNSLDKTTREDQTKTHPNKLSERIVKCLVVIFIRLLRSSRAAEMEKSGSLARSGNLQGSFRIDAAALNAAVGAAKEKERGQQDHYGIFAVQDSVLRDIGPYKNLVRFTSGAFDLRGFSSSPLLTKLREMLEALQQVDVRFLTHQQKLAFWINIYNTCIMHGILQHGLPSSSEKLLALKNKATINVSGQKFNALVIENFILRQPSSVKEELWKCNVDVEEQQVRSLYGLNISEPNILFALCCGIRSSPALRIYKAERVILDLEKAKLDYLQASLVVTSSRRLMIPGLIHSNMHDFAKDMESLLRWICDQLPTSWSLRKSMVDCLRGQHGHSKVDDVVEVIPYDYEFQYLLPM